MPRFHTITVEKLRELLEDEPGDQLVIFSSDYGDRSHTQQAHPLEGYVERVSISESAYSHSGFEIDTDDEREEEYDRPYLVIR